MEYNEQTKTFSYKSEEGENTEVFLFSLDFDECDEPIFAKIETETETETEN